MPASPSSWPSRSRPRRSTSAILNVVANPRPFIRTKTYFGPDRRRNLARHERGYVGPERRKGGKSEVIRQTPLLDKAKVAG